MLRQRCTSGDEHQYHIDQMKNFLKSDIVWESRKEILASPHLRKTKPLVQSCQGDLEAPALSLINQDLLYLKKGSSGPEKIVFSLHKFPAIIFNDVDIEEWTSRWKEPGKPKEVFYSNLKIIQVIKTYWELGNERKFIIEIVARRSNECIVSITEPDYKNLNKNNIKDIYLLIMNGKVPDYAKTGLLWSLSVFIRSLVIWDRVHDFQLGIESYQQKVNLAAPTISFLGIEKHKIFSIIYEPVHGIIYKNSKKEKRVMRHSEIYKELTNYEVEYLKLFEEEIEVSQPDEKMGDPRTTTSTKVPTTDMIVMTSMIELESLFGPLFDEYFNGENQVVSKSFAVTTADASDKRQQQPDLTSSTSTLVTTISADGNFDL
ncbi:hypothetical protein Tco_1570668 [Tanacetum coccineum]